MKISKEEFLRVINTIILINNKLDKLNNYYFTLGVIEYSLQDTLIDLLELSMNDKSKWVSWWIYDNKFGKSNLTVTINNKQILIDTPEKLYDLIKEEI